MVQYFGAVVKNFLCWIFVISIFRCVFRCPKSKTRNKTFQGPRVFWKCVNYPVTWNISNWKIKVQFENLSKSGNNFKIYFQFFSFFFFESFARLVCVHCDVLQNQEFSCSRLNFLWYFCVCVSTTCVWHPFKSFYWEILTFLCAQYLCTEDTSMFLCIEKKAIKLANNINKSDAILQ